MANPPPPERATLSAPSFLDGQFLVAMPGMADERFARSVIYVCAHSADGAMGIIVNKAAADISMPDLLVQLEVAPEADAIRLRERVGHMPVLMGGPVEGRRGFVLHTDDFHIQQSTLIIDDGICLESEIMANGWLNCPADPALIFHADLDAKYERTLRGNGIDPAMLSMSAGRA